MLFDAGILERWAAAILEASGAKPEAAAVTAGCMIDAERRGVETHGLVQLRQYLPRLRSGAIDGSANCETAVDLPGLTVVDGHNGLGAFVMHTAVQLACDKAEANGAAVSLVRNSNHFGAASSFSEQAAVRGCFALVVSNSDPGMAPLGGLGPLLGTNPLALAGPPTTRGEMPSLDIAASTAALGKVRAALQRGDTIPLGWAIGPDGAPTDDPARALEGSMLAMGGHKGFGLAFMIDVLVGAVAGSNTSPQITSDVTSTSLQRVGHAVLAVNIAAVRPAEDYASDVAELSARVRTAPRAAGTDPFLTPGQREAEIARGRVTAIPIDATVAAYLESLGTEFGCPFPGATA